MGMLGTSLTPRLLCHHTWESGNETRRRVLPHGHLGTSLIPRLLYHHTWESGNEIRRRVLPHGHARDQSHSQAPVPPHMGVWE